METLIELDRLRSLIACYHILNLPTDLTRRYNPGVYSSLQVSGQEKSHYRKFLSDVGMMGIRASILLSKVHPEVRDLDVLFREFKTMPDNVKQDVRSFEARFDEYFKGIQSRFEADITSRKRETDDYIDSIYDEAEEISGIALQRPDKLEVRVVEGMSPSSFANNDSGNLYIFDQTRNYFNRLGHLMALIHEGVGHQTVEASGAVRGVYEIEEGFVKFFSDIIANSLFGRSNGNACPGAESISYAVFERNFDRLNGRNFREWYNGCHEKVRFALS